MIIWLRKKERKKERETERERERDREAVLPAQVADRDADLVFAVSERGRRAKPKEDGRSGG